VIRVHDIQQGSAEWHDLRRGKYTGSNAHKLLKYGAREYSLTTDSEFSGTFHTKRGHILEDEAIEIYEAVTHHKVIRPGFVTNDDYPTCGYSPDGCDGDIFDPGATLLEVKCFGEAKHMAVASGEIPLEIMAQIHFGLLVTGLRQARLILYHPKLDPQLAFKVINVKARPAIERNFKRILKGRVPA
jgi:hypothetical protein